MTPPSCSPKIDSTGMELVQHGTALFPMACYCDDLLKDPVPCHWHTEWELGIAHKGSTMVTVGQKRMTLTPGEGYFINSGVIHGVFQCGIQRSRVHVAVFHPRLVGGSVESIFWQNYVQPLIDDHTRPCILFQPSVPWQKEALDSIQTALTCYDEQPDGYDLTIRNALSHVAFLLSRHRPAASAPLSEKTLREENRIKLMLQFIQENYTRELSVEEIANSAGISKSECLRCFSKTIGAPPIQFLNLFRLHKAAGLLAATDMGVAEIGGQCGFADASYFTKTFRKWKGVTPLEYRKEQRDPH